MNASLLTQPKLITPARIAVMASRGRWTCPDHLKLLNRKLVDLAAGRIRRLLVTMPPRHGKSEIVSKYFPAWYLGAFPDRRVILASYEADFAASWGRKVRDILAEHGPAWFGVSVRQDSRAVDQWDLEGRSGGMVTAGVGGALTGKGSNLFLIDDPIKNAEQANSAVYREKTWDWYASTAYTRLEPGAGIVLILTRWHEDDLAGRILAGDEHWEHVNFPALAEPGDPLGRPEGMPLWPARFDLADLSRIRATLGTYHFSALYQQRPQPPGGDFFRIGWFPIVDAAPAHAQRVRFWDKAGTQGGGAYTAGVRMARAYDGLFYVEHVVRGQWSAGERERVIRQTAELDGLDVNVMVEQEPGSAGKESAQSTILNLAGFVAAAETATGDKAVRAMPYAAQAEAGNVRLVRGDWIAAYLAELTAFPTGRFKDQVDASSGAFNKLALMPTGGTPAVGGARPPITTHVPGWPTAGSGAPGGLGNLGGGFGRGWR